MSTETLQMEPQKKAAALPGLTVVIPALNEEEAIGGTIQRCLDATQGIQESGGVGFVEIIVVSDGSTDKTVEIAQSFAGVKVIVFKENQGYGAAIKEGWRQGTGELVSFLDADGTCDPIYFAEMCRCCLQDSADVVLGSRLGPDSKMPPIRRLGNRIFAFLLGFLCGRHVTDTASGMRVVRRRSLDYLYPLPDGLHFTPSMSARALLNDLRVIEIPMTYSERIGRSKLSVLRDGVQFLKTITEGVLCYRPERILLFGFLLCMAPILLLAPYPVEFYFRNGQLEDWMIYRFVVCQFFASCGLLLLLATALADRVSFFGPRRRNAASFWPSTIAAMVQGWSLWVLVPILLGMGIFFLWPGIVEYGASGKVYLHWSRLIAGTFVLLSAAQVMVFGLLLKVVSIWTQQGEAAPRMMSEEHSSTPESDTYY